MSFTIEELTKGLPSGVHDISLLCAKMHKLQGPYTPTHWYPTDTAYLLPWFVVPYYISLVSSGHTKDESLPWAWGAVEQLVGENEFDGFVQGREYLCLGSLRNADELKAYKNWIVSLMAAFNDRRATLKTGPTLDSLYDDLYYSGQHRSVYPPPFQQEFKPIVGLLYTKDIEKTNMAPGARVDKMREAFLQFAPLQCLNVKYDRDDALFKFGMLALAQQPVTNNVQPTPTPTPFTASSTPAPTPTPTPAGTNKQTPTPTPTPSTKQTPAPARTPVTTNTGQPTPTPAATDAPSPMIVLKKARGLKLR